MTAGRVLWSLWFLGVIVMFWIAAWKVLRSDTDPCRNQHGESLRNCLLFHRAYYADGMMPLEVEQR